MAKLEEIEKVEEVKDEEVEDEKAEGAEKEEVEVTEGDVDSDKVHKLKKKGTCEKKRSFVWLQFEKFTDDKNITWVKCKYYRYLLMKPLNDIIGLERDLNEFLILENEWNALRELCRIFKMFYYVILYISNSQFVILSSSILIYNSLLEHLKKLLDENNKKYYCKSSEVHLAITKEYIEVIDKTKENDIESEIMMDDKERIAGVHKRADYLMNF
ncbi:hypothetical protein C1646_677921 [Rhizophagus diaphanus]|nr:hypothetical protein C1646_677921 [Rhizophagus diaphanus] [Rhizophagus sp. MUCL 43196]